MAGALSMASRVAPRIGGARMSDLKADTDPWDGKMTDFVSLGRVCNKSINSLVITLKINSFVIIVDIRI